ncbi:MAG: hypothetical protein JEZ02_09130 [Desulfatibacillum sp.]|nr:hypothetical protein [Desulfatibacillum sp.]
MLKNGGDVWSWGSNQYNQLGKGLDLNTEYLNKTSYGPAQIPDISNIADINAGRDHTMIQKSDGSVWSVGLNHRGQFGDGNCLWANIPYASAEWQQALITGSLMQLETFEYNTAFLKTDGSVWMCGANSVGQVGTGSTSSYVDVPTKVAGLKLTALEGDVDGNGVLNLADAVSVFQVLVGISPAASVRAGADVNGDGVIGLAEAIYILQSVAGFR